MVALGEAEIYDPASGLWSTTGPLSDARFYHTATLLPNGKVLVVGGFGSSATLASAELYDPAAASWSPTGRLINARGRHSAMLLPDGTVLVAVGPLLVCGFPRQSFTTPSRELGVAPGASEDLAISPLLLF